MTERTYLDFDVLVEPASATSYRARGLHSPVGETRPVPVTIPFSDLELENFLLRIGRPRRYLVRSEDEPEATAVRDFGARLFDAVFHDQVHSALAASLDQAEGRDAGLRVRLRLTDSPELADLPWEYLYDTDAPPVPGAVGVDPAGPLPGPARAHPPTPGAPPAPHPGGGRQSHRSAAPGRGRRVGPTAGGAPGSAARRTGPPGAVPERDHDRAATPAAAGRAAPLPLPQSRA